MFDGSKFYSSLLLPEYTIEDLPIFSVYIVAIRLKRIFTLGFLSVWTLAPCLAQTNTKEDSVYFVKINDYFNASVDIETDFETFEIQGDNFDFDIRPNFDFVNKIGIDYRALSIFYSHSPNWSINKDNDLKGESKSSVFGFSWNTNRMINHISKNKVTGYYLANSADFNPNFVEGENPYIQFELLETSSFKGFHALKLNRNFSYSAFSAQMALQTRSAGSFAPGISYNYYSIDNNTPTGQKSKNLEFIFNLPYYHTFVVDRKWYINLGLIPGVGMTTTWLKTPLNGEIVETTSHNFISRISGIAGLGYNSKGFYGGIEGKVHKRYQNQSNNAVKEEITGLAFRVFLGWHILAPRPINRLYDKIESRLF